VPLLREAVKERPKDFNAHYLLGGALAQTGQTEDALREWRLALEIQPDHLKLLQLMTVEYLKGRYFQEGAAQRESGPARGCPGTAISGPLSINTAVLRYTVSSPWPPRRCLLATA
jgi:tetratricopeptide (TPR) repeat protein